MRNKLMKTPIFLIVAFLVLIILSQCNSKSDIKTMNTIQKTINNLNNIALLSPSPGSLMATTNEMLFFHFNTNVRINPNESIKIYNQDNTLFEEVLLNSNSLIDVKPNRIIVKPSKKFLLGNAYYIKFSNTVFSDNSTVIDDKGWSFTCGIEHEEAEFYSEFINDSFRLLISVPESYSKNKQKKYKVAYITDGGFFNYSQYNEIATAYTNNEIEELITVGITYPKNYTINDIRNFRRRDLAGNPQMLLSFLKTTIIPYIDNNYRTQKDSNVLIGNSGGGLFVSYVLTTYREDQDFPFKYLFSVAQLYDFFKEESEMAANISDLPLNFFLGIGSMDTPNRIVAFNSLKDNLINRNYKSFNFKYKIYEGMPHGEISGNAAFKDAFKFFLKNNE